MSGRVILAAGGIVFRKKRRPEIAIVQLRKYPHWVLPKGKLKRNEKPRSAAMREVVEETGHKVTVQEFLGAIAYESSGRSKVVQFWRMKADGETVQGLASDIREIRWLSVKKALATLSLPREQIFLRHALAPAETKKRTRRKRSRNGH